MTDDQTFERTRRSVLRAAVSALGLGAAGSAAGHPGGYDKEGSSTIDGQNDQPFGLDDGDPFVNASAVGYHSIGGVGPASRAGRRRQRHDGDRNAEVRVHGDIAVTCFRSAGSEDPGRRLAVLDITEFNDAQTEQELADAEVTVLSILRNTNAEANLATDVKLSGDGNYAFLGTQALVPYGGVPNPETLNLTDPRARPQTSGGVVAVDISDPSRPRTVATLDAPFSTGVHNLYHHRIGGEDYVFACKDVGLISPDSGLVVVRFDRDAERLVVVNRWTADGNTVRGGVGTEHGLSYVHDVEVHDDPRTGRPTAYLADWDRGMRVLDVSDPTNIQHVGQFDMYQAHFATFFPDVVELPNGKTKRVAIASHEEPDERFDQRNGTIDKAVYKTPHWDKTNPNSTGTVFLVDCDGIYPEDPNYDESAGPKQLGELDNWTWKNVDTDDGVAHADILQSEFSFTLSPHNSQVEKHVVGGEERFVVHQGHYHGGARYLAVQPGTEDGLTGDARRDYQPLGIKASNTSDAVDEEIKDESLVDGKIGWINNTTDWTLTDVGHARPQNTKTGDKTPDFWSSVEHNGVTYSGDRSAGVWVTHYADAPLTAPRPPLEVSRVDDGLLFGAGGTNQIDIQVDTYERAGEAASILVRDRMPAGYEVVGGDALETYPQGIRTAVEFEVPVDPGERHQFRYFAEVDDDPGEGTFGPVEVSSDGGETWVTVAGTLETAYGAGTRL